jgi:D-alanyl-lipoteichoic acid acyltransferase DltB (MBOAT superfamily)
MIVPSVPFLLFALVGALAFNALSFGWWRKGVLLVLNVAFLATFSHSLLAYAPLLGFLALGFVGLNVTREERHPRLFVALLVVTIVVFVWLKRYNFVPRETFLAFPYALIGLSYIFFRVLHLIIDSHQDAVGGKVSVVSYLNYTLNFTSLVSGPIQRYQDFHRTEEEPLPLDLVTMGVALERIVIGYFKVAVVSLALSAAHQQAIQSAVSGAPFSVRVWAAVGVAGIYPIYLYFNFSGYTDVVVGVARFFRIQLPENFNRPFSAENFIAFWGRWHMTLSGWLRTYVYNPIMMTGMSRITAPDLVRYISVFALFVTFFLVGLWHGQTTEFLFFGFLQGGGVAANQLYQMAMQSALGSRGYRTLAANPIYRAVSRGLTFTWFGFTLLWFWSTWTQIGTISQHLRPPALLLAALAIWAGATIVLAAIEAIRPAVLRLTWGDAPIVLSRYVRTAWLTTLVLVTVSITLLLNSPAPDIVYKSF